MLKGFRQFILKGNVVDLAIAVVIGAAFGTVIASFVKDLLTPLIAAIGGQPDFSSLYFTLNNSRFMYGEFINAIISFLIIGAAVYFLVVVPMNRLKSKPGADEAPAAPNTRKCPECLSEIPLQARKCAFCASAVSPVSSVKTGT